MEFSRLNGNVEFLFHNFELLYHDLKKSLFFDTIAVAVFFLILVACNLKLNCVLRFLNFLRNFKAPKKSHSDHSDTKQTEEIVKVIEKIESENSLDVLKDEPTNQEEKSIKDVSTNVVDVCCESSDGSKIEAPAKKVVDMIRDDLELRRELLDTQQKLVSKMKEVKKLEKSLQFTINNSTMLSDQNNSSNKTSNISRRASFFHSTFLPNKSIKPLDSFEDVICESDEVSVKLKNSQEQALQFFQKMQDLNKKMKQVDVSGYLNQKELLSLRDLHEQILLNINDLDHNVSTGLEKIDKLKNQLSLEPGDENEKADDTSLRNEKKEYSQLVSENTDLRKSLDKMRHDYQHAMKELIHANEDRESLEFEINSVRSGLNHQLKHLNGSTCRNRGGAKIVKPVKPRRSRSCGSAKKDKAGKCATSLGHRD